MMVTAAGEYDLPALEDNLGESYDPYKVYVNFSAEALFDEFDATDFGNDGTYKTIPEVRQRKLSSFSTPIHSFKNYTGIDLWVKDLAGNVFLLKPDTTGNNPSRLRNTPIHHNLSTVNRVPTVSLGEVSGVSDCLILHEILNPLTMHSSHNPLHTLPSDMTERNVYDQFRKHALQVKAVQHERDFNTVNNPTFFTNQFTSSQRAQEYQDALRNQFRVSSYNRIFSRELIMRGAHTGGLIIPGTPYMVFTSCEEATDTRHFLWKAIDDQLRGEVEHTGLDICVLTNPNEKGAYYTNINDRAIPVKVYNNLPEGAPPECRITSIGGFDIEQKIKTVPLEMMFNEGVLGIRLYHTEGEAIDDVRRPLSPIQKKIHDETIAQYAEDLKEEKLKTDKAKAQLKKEIEAVKEELAHEKEKIADLKKTTKLEKEKEELDNRYRKAQTRLDHFGKIIGIVGGVIAIVAAAIALWTK